MIFDTFTDKMLEGTSEEFIHAALERANERCNDILMAEGYLSTKQALGICFEELGIERSEE